MIWSTTRRMRSWSGGSPIRKSRCRQMPARAGARRSRSTPSLSSPRASGALEDRAAHGRLGADDLLAEGGGELRVTTDGGEHTGERRHGAVVGEPSDAAEGGEQVAAQRAGVDRLVRSLLGQERVDDEGDLAVPAAVERGLGGAGGGGHRVHRQAVVADLLEHLEGGVEDLLLAVALDAGAGALGRERTGRAGVRIGVHGAPDRPDETKRFRFVRRLQPPRAMKQFRFIETFRTISRAPADRPRPRTRSRPSGRAAGSDPPGPCRGTRRPRRPRRHVARRRPWPART